MIRIILGVIAGFLAWSIVWIGSDQVMVSTIAWYGEHQNAFEKAFTNKEPFQADSTVLAMNIVRSIITSLMAGYLTAIVANENRRSTMILGLLLLLFGAAVEIAAWNYLPVWYHAVFLALLIPCTIVGGKIKKFA
ncbi:MAG TPA: hypothetical protein PLP07_09040 [Pyrinomonadaceae bacterium]|jgi:MFS family permease|nr:hypothetical protein [Chloracidobacterium sp.]MBP9936862.1 hypothetical protein [Pyrinomonadaceae bacterium]MBK7802033.1 hypothetical protein [Chloracidobacterium sp.]MBK9437821.1 hypothetical protein [Chloracidobacterium sp.]MBK9765764.1 hypothetical protein [Chloracidobacterium sp.]